MMVSNNEDNTELRAAIAALIVLAVQRHLRKDNFKTLRYNDSAGMSRTIHSLKVGTPSQLKSSENNGKVYDR